ncbi:GntR family transcriptional regulator [Jatrophihabitans telluris]|uniref:GntR family transcriptional regulator n=1 Tax=Jatrophihabitans telluris TaxID=2038343 RepID=A0ABY4R1T4_9ACTN|nr:GntR family transcriptional regulator [Jatrophihabitans telluris]UQX89809.1 GntR family transcriptional regulator [Jatrophihabitans telluris]
MVADAPREPKYYLVKRHLLDLIAELAPGSPVPTERELSELVTTSRTTVRQALSELVTEGRLVRRQGSGTYVAEPKLAWPLQMSSFTQQAASSGLKVETRLVAAERVRASTEIAERLGLKVGAPVHRIERLREVNGSPMALEQSHLSAKRFPGLVRALRQTGSLYQVLSTQYDVSIAHATQTIETAPAAVREAELLETDTGSPMLILTRHSVAADGEPVEWVVSWYRGDRYTFVASLNL